MSPAELKALVEEMRAMGVKRIRTPELEVDLADAPRAENPTPPKKRTPEEMKELAGKLGVRRLNHEDLMLWSTGEELPAERIERQKREAQNPTRVAAAQLDVETGPGRPQ